MPNTNFQTFHQMGQAINEVVRQATGRDAVQNIDMDHVTVAQTRFHEKVTVEGSIASFIDSVGGIPLEKCIAYIEPVQDLHGYSKPWAGGAGKNLISLSGMDMDKTVSGITLSTSGSELTIRGTATAEVQTNATLASQYTQMPMGPFPAGTYTINATGFEWQNANDRLILNARYSDNSNVENAYGKRIAGNKSSVVTFTATQEFKFGLFMALQSGSTFDCVVKVQFESGPTATSYEPYSNICPISGWTGANIYVSPTTNAQDGQTYSVAFPAEAGTVYGGMLDVTTGTLLVTDGHIASYNGEALPGRWISDRDAYTEGTVPTTGAQVVYELDNPITYTLTPQRIRTLAGQNNIWTNTGDIEVQYIML